MKGFFYLLFLLPLLPLQAEPASVTEDPQSVLFGELALFTGRTPRMDILREALEEGADPLLLNDEGLSSCHLAVIGGHPQILELLLGYVPEGQAFQQGLEQFNRYMPFFALTHQEEKALPLLEILLDQGYSPDMIDPEGVPLLTRCVYHSPGATELLLSRGAETELTEPYGITPLMRAGSLEEGPRKMKLLLAYGADPEARDFDGWNALFYTVLFGGGADAVQVLLDQGMGINSRDSYGSSLLLWSAAYRQDLSMIRFLIDRGASPSGPDKDGWIPLMAALHWNNTPKVVEYLSRFLEDGRVRDGLGRPLDSYFREYLASRDLPLDPAGLRALSRRVYPADAVPHSDLNLSLHETARWGEDTVMITRLVEAGADINAEDENSWSPLMKAAACSFPDMVGALLVGGADPFYRTPEGWTALHVAAWSGSSSIFRQLLAAGSDPNLADQDGWTAFHWAARNRAPLEALELLIATGADVDALNGKGESPLYLMASGWEEPDPRSLSLVLGSLSDPDRADFQGITPLMKAAARGFAGTVGILLEAGADARLKDQRGNRAEDFAAAQGHPDIVDLLRSR